jgi:hypothetical protein
MKWRYQPVLDPDGSCVLVEVFYDGDKPIGYAELHYNPVGNDQDDLIDELKLMLRDAKNYRAITRAELDAMIPTKD